MDRTRADGTSIDRACRSVLAEGPVSMLDDYEMFVSIKGLWLRIHHGRRIWCTCGMGAEVPNLDKPPITKPQGLARVYTDLLAQLVSGCSSPTEATCTTLVE